MRNRIKDYEQTPRGGQYVLRSTSIYRRCIYCGLEISGEYNGSDNKMVGRLNRDINDVYEQHTSMCKKRAEEGYCGQD